MNIAKNLIHKTGLLDKVYGAVQKLSLPLERSLLQANSLRLERSYCRTIFILMCLLKNMLSIFFCTGVKKFKINEKKFKIDVE
jgi:hypothetical protein